MSTLAHGMPDVAADSMHTRKRVRIASLAAVPPLNMMGFCLIGNGYAYYRTNRDDRWVTEQVEYMAERFSEEAE